MTDANMPEHERQDVFVSSPAAAETGVESDAVFEQEDVVDAAEAPAVESAVEAARSVYALEMGPQSAILSVGLMLMALSCSGRHEVSLYNTRPELASPLD